MIKSEDILDYSMVGNRDILWAFVKNHNCVKCPKVKKRLEEMKGGDEIEKIITMEVENGSLNNLEKTEIKLRNITKYWTHFNYIVCIPQIWTFQIKSKIRHQEDQNNNIEWLNDLGLAKLVEGVEIK